jgi:hypothetical protein
MSKFPSTRRLATALAAILAGSCSAAVSQAQHTVGDAIQMAYGRMGTGPRPTLLGVRVNDSIDGEVWSLQFHDPNSQSQRRLVTLRDGQFAGDAPEVVWPFTQGTYDPLRADEVALPVSNLRKIAAERATRNNLKPASLTYVLNHRTGESSAFWEIYLVDHKRIIIGHIRVDASGGVVIREEFSVGGASATPAPQAGTSPQASSSPQTNSPPQTSTSAPRIASKPTAPQHKASRQNHDSNPFHEIGQEVRRIFD